MAVRSLVPALALAGSVLMAAGCTASTPVPSTGGAAADLPWVAFQASLRHGQFGDDGVFLVRPNGADQHEVATSVPGEHIHPAWSRDGRTLLFAALIGDRDQIMRFDPLTDPTGVHARRLTACADLCLDDMDPALSPNDSQLAYVQIGGPIVPFGDIEVPATQEIRIATVTSTGLTKTRTVLHTATTTMELNAPRWSPDGSHLVFWIERHADDSGQPVDQTAVFTIRADGSDLVPVTPWSMLGGDCDWSPDGTHLVFATHPLQVFNFDAVVSNLFTVRPDGTGLRQLTHSTTSNDRATQAHFTPDGRIIYTRVTQRGRILGLMKADGSNRAPIPGRGEHIRTHGDWQPATA